MSKLVILRRAVQATVSQVGDVCLSELDGAARARSICRGPPALLRLMDRGEPRGLLTGGLKRPWEAQGLQDLLCLLKMPMEEATSQLFVVIRAHTLERGAIVNPKNTCKLSRGCTIHGGMHA